MVVKRLSKVRLRRFLGLSTLALLLLSSCARGLTGVDNSGGATSITKTPVPTITLTPYPSDAPAATPTATLSPTSTATATPTLTNTPTPRVTIASDTLCFAGPGQAYTIIGSLMKDTPVEVVGIGFGGGWYIINHPLLIGLTCWVDEGDLHIEGVLPDLPIWTIPPVPSITPTLLRSVDIPCWTATPGGPIRSDPHPVCVDR